MAFYFNRSGFCESCALVPKDIITVNNLVEKYNKEYVAVSNTEWKFYGNQGIIKINLIWSNTQDEVPAFWFSSLKND